MKVEMGKLTIKNSAGKVLTITYEEAKQLKEKLKQIFPDQYWGDYYRHRPYWWEYQQNGITFGPGDDDYGRREKYGIGDVVQNTTTGDGVIDLTK